VDVRGNVLAFSGEIFGGVAGAASGAENDAAALLAAFDEVFARAPDDEGIAASALVARLRGPWALAYWHEASKRLWFGRDVFGRRSLLLRRVFSPGPAGDARRDASPRATGLVLSSVAPERGEDALSPETDDWEELEPGLYCVDARAAGKENERAFVPDAKRAAAAPRSGALAERLRRFRRARAATRPAVERALTEDASARGETEDSDTEVNDEKKNANTARDAAVDGFVAALAAAVERRVALSVADPLAPRGNGTSDVPSDGRAFIGVLFSGGVDSMLLAALAHRHVPPGRAVDLINVCFDGGSSPDRAAALDGAAELQALFPARDWRLVRVDADVEEVRRGLPAARLAGLLRPARTVMDRNIGAALWLAARGEGWVDVASAPAASRAAGAAGVRVPYASRARVLLLGQGADEQCAGYSRHRAAFRAGASSGEAIRALAKEEGPAEGLSPARDWEALGDAVRLDATRLWRRNMGRDDRLVSDRGREARFPFLDEGVAARLLATPLCDVADLSGHAGGDKLLVRAAARRLGMHRAAARAKRAIQFGSRVSKKFDVEATRGSRRAARGAGASVSSIGSDA
jgi:asparagine synthetase B (glutamine-hydrolysing)